MKKYLVVFFNSLAEYFSFRTGLVIWRIRVIISIMVSYFLWQTVYQSGQEVFGYNISQMLTYFFLLFLINSIVFSSQTFRIAEDINFGHLSNYLLRPVNYFFYILSKDIADKFLNICFSVMELTILILLLNPPIFIQENFRLIAIFMITVAVASVLYFEIGIVLSLIGFWTRETWAPRFIFSILVSFLAGNFFPLDILPSEIYLLLRLTPFPYLVFFPLKLYLGNIDILFITSGYITMSAWIIFLGILIKKIWNRGLQIYTSEGL